MLAVLVEKADPSSRVLAGKSTLNRLELTKETASRKERYKKIVLDHGAVDRLLVEVFLQAHREEPKEIILDLDATDDPLHGEQGRFFHGYYGHYCYLPLYIFCGEFPLCARLRSSNIDASAGSVAELQRIVEQIRSAWPLARIVVRGDLGFCREELMVWCEANRVEYLLGLAKNERLKAEIAQEMGAAKAQYENRTRGPVIQRVRLPDTGELEPCATGGGQGRTSGEGCESTICGDVFEYEQAWAAQALYEEQYCGQRRDGESHQGTTDAVQRPHQHGVSAQQSNALVLLFGRVRAVAEPATTGTGGNGLGEGAVHDDSAEAAEDRGADSHHGTKSVGVAGRWVPLCRAVPASP